ncbi:MAG: BNR-4 repeat-containing protein [Saprospiraceae bacterium]
MFKKTSWPCFIVYFLYSFGVSSCSAPKPETAYLTDDGAWCWFSDPRAIYNGQEIITGWVKADGTIEAAAFNPQTKAIVTKTLYPKLQSDDHDNPAFVKTANGHLIATYTSHSGKDGFFMNTTSAGMDISSFGEAVKVPLLDSALLEEFPKVHVTYANPYRLQAENNRLYCFGRWTGYKPNMMWSDDDGKTWTTSKVMITNYPFDPNNRPYAKYYSDGISKIHIIFTDGHPRVEPTNSVYYAYYEAGAFYKADGSKIADMQSIPFEPKDATLIYQSNETSGRAWIADVAQDEKGNPVILYTKSPSETDHRYWYAKYDGENWVNTELCSAGKWFPQTPPGEEEREVHYFGNMCLYPANTNVVYLSRQINGVFEIERWQTKDNGQTWQTKAITQGSKLDNVRPYVPREGNEQQEVVFWMENHKYIHYTDYQTAIKYYIHQ